MIERYHVPKTRAELHEILFHAVWSALHGIAAVIDNGDGKSITLQFDRDDVPGNVPNDLPDFNVVLMTDEEADEEEPQQRDDDDEIRFAVSPSPN